MEVEWYLRLERRAQARWRNEMAQLAAQLDTKLEAPALRSATAAGSTPQDARGANERHRHAFDAPAVRLAVSGANTSRSPDSFGCPTPFGEEDTA